MDSKLLTDFIKKLGFQPSNGLDILCLQGLTAKGNGFVINSNQVDQYNDLIIPILGDKYSIFVGTIDPGLYYLEHVLNNNGCAHVAFSQHGFEKGLHQGKHAALRAANERILLIRDYNRDYKFAYGDKIGFESNTGVNIHAMGSGTKVGKWSAGCIGISGGWKGQQWSTFMNDYVNKSTGKILATVWHGKDFLKFNEDKDFKPTLRFGCYSPLVEELQCKIDFVSDGIFGSGTHDAVRALQDSNELVSDGIVGKKTWAVLDLE